MRVYTQSEMRAAAKRSGAVKTLESRYKTHKRQADSAKREMNSKIKSIMSSMKKENDRHRKIRDAKLKKERDKKRAIKLRQELARLS